MKLRFDYKKILYEKNLSVLRPIIEVELATQNKEKVRYEAMIDSGADMNMFHWEIAEVLKLKKSKAIEKSKFQGVTGENALAYYYDIVLVIGGSCKKIVRCGFTDAIPNVGHGFLGQSGFFDNFRIQFNHRKEQIDIWER